MTVLTGGLPQARVTDLATCVGPPDMIVKGSATVLVSGLPAARMGDMTVHGGVIVLGCFTVLIGDAGGGGGGGGGSKAVGPVNISKDEKSGPAEKTPEKGPGGGSASGSIGGDGQGGGGSPPVAGAPGSGSGAPAASSSAPSSSPVSEEVIAERTKTAMDFFQNEMGLNREESLQLLKGLDLSQPVEVVSVPPPPTMSQFVRKSWGKPGNRFNPDPNQTADMLGLNGDPSIRDVKTFKTPVAKALKSTAAPIVDNWTDKTKSVSTKGGGIQMTVSNQTRDAFVEV